MNPALAGVILWDIVCSPALILTGLGSDACELQSNRTATRVFDRVVPARKDVGV